MRRSLFRLSALSCTATEDRVRLARDLRRYPRLRQACDAGVLGREAAALVVQLLRDAPAGGAGFVAGPGNVDLEAAWVARAAESTLMRMRDEARALGRYRVLGRRDGGEAATSDRAGDGDAAGAARRRGVARRNLADHHLRYRSRGGDDDPANRICLCPFHHQRGEHGALASCRGTAPTSVVWRLRREDMATWFRNERRTCERRLAS